MSVKVRIIGIGNPLCGDDGVGVALVERLQQRGVLPQGVEAIDGGLGGITLIDYFADVERVILIDAVDFGVMPGQIAHFRLGDLDLASDSESALLHAGLVSLLRMVSELKLCSHVDLVAVQPESALPGTGLSSNVSRVLGSAEKLILSLLA